jgi:AcrR family transcriptional regulator
MVSWWEHFKHRRSWNLREMEKSSRRRSAPAKKLSKAERRQQLLATAHEIVRREGTDALTLGYLAERAGVTKPIAYEHFATRAGLLVALYQEIDDRSVASLMDALKRTKPRLADVARVIAKAYVDCYRTVGPEWHTVSAALKGDEQMERFQQALTDRYAAIYCDAFAPYTRLAKEELRLRCLAIIAAGDAITRELGRGRVGEGAAVATLASLIIASLPDSK